MNLKRFLLAQVLPLMIILSPAYAILTYQNYQQKILESNPEVYGTEYDSTKSVRISPILPNQLEAIALNAYAEARGEGEFGMIAVTNTVRHRVNDPNFPKTYHDVIYQPKQFSWTNAGKVIEINDEESWKLALHIARLELKGKLPDLVNGARYYANVSKVDLTKHKWVSEYKPLAEIGNHLYMDNPKYIKANNLTPLPANKLSKKVRDKLKSTKPTKQRV